MTLEDLRTLVMVAEAKSLGEVARKLGCTQPAVAQHIRRLELQFDTVLLLRARRGSTLTKAGEILYRRASHALRALQVAEQELKAERQSSPELALAASTTSTEHLLKGPILALRKRWPGLLLRMEMGTTVFERLEAVRQRRVDLAFVTLAKAYKGIQTRPVLDMPLLLLVHRDHRFARKKRLSLGELREIRYIALRNSTAVEYIGARLAARGSALEVADTVDTPATAILHVELGLGETLVPAHQAASFRTNGLVRVLAVPELPPTPLGWASLDFELLPPMASALMDEVAGFARRWRRRA
jgi:DNA-binding transcriptional LysR family regulator